MKVENGKFYSIKDKFFDIFQGYKLMENSIKRPCYFCFNDSENKEIIETSINVIKLAKKGINIPFYDIIEMKNILLKNYILTRWSN